MFYLISRNLEDGVLKNSAAPGFFYPLIDVCRISERALLRVLDTLHKPWWEEKPVSTYTAIPKKVVGVEDFTDFTSGLNSN